YEREVPGAFGETMRNRARYLIFFQYIGTRYNGAVKVPPQQLKKKGVQDHLEDAIRKLRPLNPVSLSISSRTDTGVHALSNSAHFDLQRKNDKPPFTEDVLVSALNFHLKTEQISFSFVTLPGSPMPTECLMTSMPVTVPTSRTYVYRIALGIPHYCLLPLTDCDLCWNLHNTELDMGAMREATALLVGTHDFSSFRAINSDLPFKNPVKTLDVVCIQPGNSFVQAHFHRWVSVFLFRQIPFWELTFTGRSFLYKQVRRMTGALVAVGQGRLSVPQLNEILEARDSRAYPQGLVAPAHGLFLTRVEYRQAGEEAELNPSN
ncbi:hypothetical protein L3Q82_025052, partial [Scortum barcoo]